MTTDDVEGGRREPEAKRRVGQHGVQGVAERSTTQQLVEPARRDEPGGEVEDPDERVEALVVLETSGKT
jgi:hypothetical protein